MVDLLIPGPEGKIEAKYSHNKNNDSPIVVILHPDPSKGGTMHTKIVFKLYKIFIEAGFSTIRFNFRGVGKSQGIFDDGEGELSDAACVLDWLQQYNTDSKICWVAGFSFGAWIFNPSFLIIISFLAIDKSSSIISLTNSSKEVDAFQPNSFDALEGSPSSVSTSHGRKYLGSILTTTFPLSALIPTSSKPLPSHKIAPH